jgi:hypothetical protein
LNWWITPGPVAVPIVTTGNPASPTAGVLGDPSTVVLFGNSNIDFGALPGGRICAGYWFDCDSTFGVEASAFLLSKESRSFNFSSDASGNPLLVIPFQTAAGAQTALLISSPAIPQTGSVNVDATTQLWGADCLAAWRVYQSCDCRWLVTALAGFQYFDLNETLQISDNTSANPPPVIVPTGDFRIVTTTSTQQSGFDFFGTRNQFYGGEIGARAVYHKCRWSAEILGLLAMGATVQTLYTGGSSTSTTTTTAQLQTLNGTLLNSRTISTTTPTAGNVFLGPNNIGSFENSSFSVIPQISIKLGYDITCHLRATIGYDALFWDNVERPGNQISNVVGAGPQHNLSSVWVQGFDVGLNVHW